MAQGAVWSMKLNDPGLRAVTGSADFSARVWDALSGLELCQFPHKHIVRTVDFAHCSQRIVTGGAQAQDGRQTVFGIQGAGAK